MNKVVAEQVDLRTRMPNEMRILAGMPEPVVVFDDKYQVLFANRRFETLCATYELNATAFGNASVFRSVVQQVIDAGDEVAESDVVIQSAEGETVMVNLTGLPLSSTSDMPQGCICVVQDATALISHKEELAESRNLLQLVLEHMPVRVFWKDTDLNYLGCNTVFANDMGHDRPEQLVGHDDFATSMTREEATLCREDDFTVLRTGMGCFGTEEVIGTGEGQSWIRVSKVPLRNAKGDMIGVLGMYEGIDEQKRAQIELERALHRERQVNEMKSRFISTVSHEYRNPLATILATTDALIHIGDRFDAEKRKVRLEKVKHAVYRMTALMDDVLFIGREGLIDSPRAYEALDMTTLCNTVIDELRDDDLEYQRIMLVEEGEQRPLIGSRVHLIQLLRNVLDNALKYSAEFVQIRLAWQPTQLEIAVVDRGIGMESGTETNAFESFYRGSNVGTIEGTGLGLYLVRHITDMHQGRVSLTSQLGQGTTVTIALPYKPLPLEQSRDEDILVAA